MKAMLLILLLALSADGFSQPEIWGGDISVEQAGDVFTSLTVRAKATLFFNGVEPADAPAEIELCWGDGNCSFIPLEFVNPLENNTIVGVYTAEHTYPSRGTYVVSIVACCFSGDILSFDSGEDMPIQIRNTFTLLDPQFQGTNSQPVMLQPALDIGRPGVVFDYNPNLYDAEGDSLSYRLVELTGPSAYLFPQEFDNCTNSFSIDPVTGSLGWDAPCLPGRYVFGIEVKEWRDQLVISEKLILLQVIVEMANSVSAVSAPGFFRPAPNPAYGSLWLMGKSESPVHFSLYNNRGQLAREWPPLQLPEEVSLTGLPTGIYFLRGITGNRTFVHTIIKH